MSFHALVTKVSQAEHALEASERNVLVQWQRLGATWRANLTPTRIVLTGLATGFAVGRSRPLRLLGGGGVLNMVNALSGLFAGVGAHVAAANAQQAAEAAEDAADSDAGNETDVAVDVEVAPEPPPRHLATP